LDNFSDVFNVNDLDTFLDRRGYLYKSTMSALHTHTERRIEEEETHVVLNIGFATHRSENLLDSRSVGSEDLLLESTNWEYLSSESHFTGHSCEREESEVDYLRSGETSDEVAYRVRMRCPVERRATRKR
jgi:hypothetical protein